jgi:hypothetical protein
MWFVSLHFLPKVFLQICCYFYQLSKVQGITSF